MLHTIPIWVLPLGLVSLLALLVLAHLTGRLAGYRNGLLIGENARELAVQKIAELNAALAHAVEQWQASERKAESYRSFNSSTLGERDKWQTLYHEQSYQHGNAQALMMEGISHLTRRLEALGQRVQIPPVLKEIQEAFLTAHVKPKPDSGQLGINNQAPETAAPGTASSEQTQVESESSENAR